MKPLARNALVRLGLAVVAIALVSVGAVVAVANSGQDDAVEQAIQRANAEQVQAIAARDPSGMTDTSTDAHFQELRQINDDLLGNGVASIALVNLEWGPVTVSGDTLTLEGLLAVARSGAVVELAAAVADRVRAGRKVVESKLGTSLLVGRPSPIHFSRGPLISFTLSCP